MKKEVKVKSYAEVGVGVEIEVGVEVEVGVEAEVNVKYKSRSGRRSGSWSGAKDDVEVYMLV